MKNLNLILLLLLFYITSCTDVKFETSQPKDGKELDIIPKSMRGVYIADKDYDTLKVYDKSFHLGNNASAFYVVDKILDKSNVVLKPYNDYFVLSLKNNGYWESVLIKQKDNKLITNTFNLITKSMSLTNGSGDSLLNILKEITKVKEIFKKDSTVYYLLINPTNEEFNKIVKKGFFKDTIVFTKIK